jgi:hypothetical protein
MTDARRVDEDGSAMVNTLEWKAVSTM